MPDMDGYELLQRIKNINASLKILPTSAFEYNSRYFARNFSYLDIGGFIEKPISIDELRKVVLTVLNNNSLEHGPNVHLL
jgi:response regulator RpfG family c-di-GMP phosphodiesterase